MGGASALLVRPLFVALDQPANVCLLGRVYLCYFAICMSWFLPLLSSLIVVFLCCPVSFLDGAPDPVETRRRRRTICQGKHPVVTFQGLSYPLFSCLSYVVLLFLCSAEAMPVGVCQSSCSRSCSSLPFVPIVRQQSAVSSSGSDPSFVSGCGRGLCRGPLLLAKKVI